MIIPSIDLQGGQTVQLVGGREKALDAGDPSPIARKFGIVGEIATIDLDAAMGTGSNAALIEGLLKVARCRVGGGIRDVATAVRWLDAGAAKVILGTAAKPEILRELPRERTIAALDARDGDVVVEGWTKGTGARILDRIIELRDHVGGFLVTFVEREGRLGGTAMEQVAAIIEAAGNARVTIAGGVTTATEVAELDRMGADAQVGMAIYTGRLHLADALHAMLTSDRPDGLIPTIVVNERNVALGLAYSSLESLRIAIDRQAGVYQSRKRGIWIKGESSGHLQELISMHPDCDHDALKFVVRQKGGFCHLPQATCFGHEAGLGALESTLNERRISAPEGSYSHRLFSDPALLSSKLREEARELTEATDPAHIAEEAADVLYFAMAKLVASGVSLAEVERILDRRALKLTRRPGNAKS